MGCGRGSEKQKEEGEKSGYLLKLLQGCRAAEGSLVLDVRRGRLLATDCLEMSTGALHLVLPLPLSFAFLH